MPDGLTNDQQLSYVLGEIVRADARILETLLFIEYEVSARDPELAYRKDTDTRTPNGVIADLRKVLPERHHSILNEVRETIRRRNLVVHTPWGEEDNGFYLPADLFMSNAVPPTAIEEFTGVAEDLVSCQVLLTQLRNDLPV